MSIHLAQDTREALGPMAGKCESRSLFAARFPDPAAQDTKDSTPRRDWFAALIGKEACAPTTHSAWYPPQTSLVYARLMGRLLVNLSGGVMENANVLMDRFGRPYIPGSAVKGCARRTALAALRDWSENGEPNEEIFTGCHAGFTKREEMLAAIAGVFGWIEQDWTDEKSDFRWAMHGALQKPATLDAESSGGLVAFFPAFPNRDPKLELDVLTPHHGAYYRGDLKEATDTEDPVPVFFPVVKSQHNSSDYFPFALAPIRGASPRMVECACAWLSCGLSVFGLGAKTAAGYGWFEDVTGEVAESIQTAAKRAADEAQRKASQQLAQEEADRKRAAKAALAETLKNLTPEGQEDKKIELLSDEQFGRKVLAFFKDPKRGGPATDAEKAAIVRALRGPRVDYWKQFRADAGKGDAARSCNEIMALSKSLGLGKMP